MLSRTHARSRHTGKGGRGRESTGAPSFLPLALVLSLTASAAGRSGSSPPLSHHDSVSLPGALTLRLLGLYADTVSRLGVSRQETVGINFPTNLHPEEGQLH